MSIILWVIMLHVLMDIYLILLIRECRIKYKLRLASN